MNSYESICINPNLLNDKYYNCIPCIVQPLYNNIIYDDYTTCVNSNLALIYIYIIFIITFILLFQYKYKKKLKFIFYYCCNIKNKFNIKPPYLKQMNKYVSVFLFITFMCGVYNSVTTTNEPIIGSFIDPIISGVVSSILFSITGILIFIITFVFLSVISCVGVQYVPYKYLPYVNYKR